VTDGQVTDTIEEPAYRRFLRQSFRLDNPRGQAAAVGALIFLLTPILSVFVSTWFLWLVVPGVLLSVAGLRAWHTTQTGTGGRLGATGMIMTANGIALMVALFVVGFISDFLVSGDNPHETDSVVFGYTTVHIMLGVGLMLVDNYRHLREE
jgi:hypothetical protein